VEEREEEEREEEENEEEENEEEAKNHMIQENTLIFCKLDLWRNRRRFETMIIISI